MTLDPILNAAPFIQLHAVCGLIGVLIGPFALYRRRRGKAHKWLGYMWVVAMALLAGTSFFIGGFEVIGPFSPLHGFAILTLWSLYDGMRHILARRIAAHQAVFRSLYWNGLLVASLFNFLPGRTVNRMLFPDMWQAGWAVIAAGAVFIAVRQVRLYRALPDTRTA